MPGRGRTLISTVLTDTAAAALRKLQDCCLVLMSGMPRRLVLIKALWQPAKAVVAGCLILYRANLKYLHCCTACKQITLEKRCPNWGGSKYIEKQWNLFLPG